MAAPVDRRSSAGSRSTPGAGVDRREPAVAQPRDPRRYPATGDAGATRGAVRHDPRPDRRHHRAAMGSGGLRRRGLRTFVSLGAPIRGGSDGGLLDQAAGPLRVPLDAGLPGPGFPARRADAGGAAGAGHVRATPAAGGGADVRRAQRRRRVFDRADRQRRERWGGGDAGGDGVPDRAADFAEAVLSSSSAWRSAVAMSGSPSMRASSRVRASPVASCTSLVATPRFAPLATTRW